LETLERAERADGEPEMTIVNLAAIKRMLKAAEVELRSPELGGGVRQFKGRRPCPADRDGA
jgi:hypothetical protein